MAELAVAMSGGVDSAAAAALLVEEGHSVVGLTMNLWPEWLPEPDDAFRACCGVTAIGDARAVAHQLGIRHYVLNLRQEFERAVIDEFVDEYARGRTPNPCIACNRAIKFSLLLRKVQAMGLEGLATGHYARIRHDVAGGRYLLLRGHDPAKDQSYVLFGLSQAQLARLRFPVGEHTKPRIRQIARSLGLPVADKADSQEICFVPRGSYADLVAQRRPDAARPGPILDRTGAQVGTHAGVGRFTIGQRRGLGLAAGRPLYVTAIDPARNAVVVGEGEDLLAGEVIARQVNWISGTTPREPLQVTARVRHGMRDTPALAWLEPTGALRVRFDEPQRAAAPGQAVALYQGEVVLGGGIIERAAASVAPGRDARISDGSLMEVNQHG
ncbi:MAG TPA: tRNA 2-thiouridine(34) synthase MnmA [bacterium]|jgi:tRNA-specific 2-thiouridylase|nr:tRNA 2-thiouridine(34) synthase MnmA [bacterium]